MRRRGRNPGGEQEGWLRRAWAAEQEVPGSGPKGRARSTAAAGTSETSESSAAPAGSSWAEAGASVSVAEHDVRDWRDGRDAAH